MALVDDRDLWNDPDLLDFEDPRQRHLVAAKMQVAKAPGTVTAARWLMYLQPALVVLIPIVVIGMNRGNNEEGAQATTTTTVAEVGQQTQGGGGGLFILAFGLGFIGLTVAVIVLAGRLNRLTPSARTAAMAIEGVVLLAGLASMSGGVRPMPTALTVSAIAVLALLFAPATKEAIVAAAHRDSSSRFDIRSLPGLDNEK